MTKYKGILKMPFGEVAIHRSAEHADACTWGNGSFSAPNIIVHSTASEGALC